MAQSALGILLSTVTAVSLCAPVAAQDTKESAKSEKPAASLKPGDPAPALKVTKWLQGPFPGCQHEFLWRREEHGGNWYASAEFGSEGWLCPALFKYFEQAPERIFVQVKAKGA